MPNLEDVSQAQRPGISAQINLAPGDFPLSKTLLARQIAFLADHVDEIVLSLDTQNGRGKFASSSDDNQMSMNALINEVSTDNPKVVLHPIDYTEVAQAKVAEFFDQDQAIPLRDLRGGPSYVYFFGLWSCAHDLVFHIDSDMFLGGAPDDWFSKALTELTAPNVFAIAPLPGPPTHDGSLRQPILDQTCLAHDAKARRYQFDGFSTRVFLTDRTRFKGIKLRGRSSLLRTLKATIKGLEPNELPEVMISEHMRQNAMHRLDTGGEGRFYTLHPPYKSKSFFAQAERILRAVENDQIPELQRGCYDVGDALYDFTDERYALAQRAWYRRLARGLFLRSQEQSA